MAHTITFPVSNGSFCQVLERARSEAQKRGIILTGDDYEGRFTNNSNVVGNYQVHGDRVVITVAKKPMLAPWSVVDQQIRELFSRKQN
ncbi:MAG TPA: hypothetical protein VIT23_07260 [Terrimicrobiaceae bacterium]